MMIALLKGPVVLLVTIGLVGGAAETLAQMGDPTILRFSREVWTLYGAAWFGLVIAGVCLIYEQRR